jgi:hypothetical protein
MWGDRECVIILQGMEESDEHFANDPVRERESIIQQRHDQSRKILSPYQSIRILDFQRFDL